MNNSIDNICGICSKPCTTGCARCKFRYCSFSCQQRDWGNHRHECIHRILQNLGIESKPSHPQNTLPQPVINAVHPLPTEIFQPVLPPVPSFSPKKITPSASCTTNEIRGPIKNIPIANSNPRKPNENVSKAQKIAITSIIRSNCVYIRDADEETNKRFRMIHAVVEQLSQNLVPIKGLPEEGTYLIVNLNGFKRCTVQEVKGERFIKVFLSDYGKQEIVAVSKLYEPGIRLEKLAETSFIKMLNLENVPEFYLNKKAAEYVKYFLGDEVFLEVEYGDQPDEGRIFDVVKNEYINDVLFCYAQEEEQEMVEYEPEDKEFTFVSEEIVKIQTIPKKELPIETEVNLIIYNNSELERNHIISCVNIDDLGDIKEIIKEIHDYGTKNDGKTYKPEEDDICIAFYMKKKKWCRGRFIEICADNPVEAMVSFIDFGKVARVPLQKIIKYPEAFSYMPSYLLTCRVFGLPQQPSEELLERLHELLPENVSVKAKSLSVVDVSFHVIELEAILKILSSEELI